VKGSATLLVARDGEDVMEPGMGGRGNLPVEFR